jgi:ABC-type nitrate/sulfonate/bicarbonate transport system substrate-binding protein
VAAVAPQPVRVGLIAPLSGYWPVYAADALGYFTREGVALDLMLTGSPSQSAQLLASGDLDLAINTPDTAIIAITKGADFAIVASAQSEALFSLMAAPGVERFNDLRGKSLALNNSPRDGIAAMTRKTLEANGVRDDEVDMVLVGGTPQRYAALKSGVVAAALLTQPQDIMAMAEGMKRLALVADVVGEWQNLSVIANHGWAKSHDDLLVRWLRGYVAACRWIQDSANRAEAVRIAAAALQAPEDIAQRTWALYFEERRPRLERGLRREAGRRAQRHRAQRRARQLRRPAAHRRARAGHQLLGARPPLSTPRNPGCQLVQGAASGAPTPDGYVGRCLLRPAACCAQAFRSLR